MNKQALHIIKIGGNIVDDEVALQEFLAQLSKRNEPFILVHGGGKVATSMSETLGIQPKLVEGRRITDTETLNVVVMVYAGL
ncbi:MAG: acetylglutamate kinase, partial [Bacteroidota bacterium]